MSPLLLLLTGIVVVNHVALAQLPALRPWRKPALAAGVAAATLFMLPFTAAILFLLDHALLQPLALQFLHPLAGSVAAIVVVCSSGLLLRRRVPALTSMVDTLQLLLVVDCLVLGTAATADTFAAAVFTGFGNAAALALLLVLFTALQERIATSDVPAPFHGSGLTLITAALMSLALLGLTGLV